MIHQDRSEQEITEQALRQSQKMDSMGQMAANIIHDFSNCFGLIIGSLDLVIDDLKSDPEILESALIAQRAAVRGSRIIERLQQFSQHKMRVMEVVEVNGFVNSLNNYLRSILEHKITIYNYLETDLWQIVVDPAELEESLLNLAINARDAMPKGGILTIKTENICLETPLPGFRPDFEPGNYVRITIEDTGSGIESQNLSRVFEPFYSSHQNGYGMGLGLSAVYGFVRRSAGQITVESKPGVGTAFVMYFPQRKLVTVAIDDSHAKTEMPKGTESILIVDDIEEIAQIAAATLIRLGYSVTSITSPMAAADLLRAQREHFDLLFTDVVMPEMNGFELAKVARSHCRNIKVLMTSGYSANLSDNDHVDELSRVLPKPYRNADLARRVRNVLDTGRTGARKN